MPTWTRLKEQVKDQGIKVVNVLGGLAPDSDQPMPIDMQHQIQRHWYRINELLGTKFNFDFWLNNEPRRSTYPACRAVLAARTLDQKHGLSESFLNNASLEELMIEAIQKAYYLRAMNPSDNSVLMLIFDELALSLGLPSDCISEYLSILRDHSTHRVLLEEIEFGRSLTSSGFPSLVFQTESKYYAVPLDYKNAQTMLDHIHACTAL
ncbi:DsbA family protein [Litoribrevibacter euphylliae]|uniref:DsbA family protein n=1 Tax=Litoribrevibacter euphylliae TaxID=1834034 RepID=A0ABV7HGL1_9GAMM